MTTDERRRRLDNYQTITLSSLLLKIQSLPFLQSDESADEFTRTTQELNNTTRKIYRDVRSAGDDHPALVAPRGCSHSTHLFELRPTQKEKERPDPSTTLCVYHSTVRGICRRSLFEVAK